MKILQVAFLLLFNYLRQSPKAILLLHVRHYTLDLVLIKTVHEESLTKIKKQR